LLEPLWTETPHQIRPEYQCSVCLCCGISQKKLLSFLYDMQRDSLLNSQCQLPC
jgi:hypothetical protein